MRIVSVEAIPVNLPFHEPVSDAWGWFPSSNHGVVVIRDDSGAYGLGEIALAWFGGAHGLCKDVNEQWAPLIVGRDVTNFSQIAALLDYHTSFSKRHLLAQAGVEMALWDLFGKRLGLPVYSLLGGRLRDRVPLTGGVPMTRAEAMVDAAQRRVAEGYKTLKIKIGKDDAGDLAVVRQIRAHIPESVSLRVDVNMAWKDVKQAGRQMAALYDLGVEIVEQPLADDRLSDLAWLRKHTEALVLIDEGVWDVADAKRNLDAEAADLLHVYITEAGGITGSRKIFELASLYGIDCTIGSMPEGRIGAAASAHVAAAMPNLSAHASDIRGFTGYVEDVTHEDLSIVDGELIIPNGPGLGVTLDEERLDRLRVDR